MLKREDWDKKQEPKSAGEILMIERSRIDRDEEQIRHVFPEEVLRARRNDIRSKKIKGAGIAGTGIESPLTVRLASGAVGPDGHVKDTARFILVDGELRWRTTEDLLETLPCIVKDISAQEARRLMREMALQTTHYSPIEYGLMIVDKMNEDKLSVRQVAEVMGVNKTTIENHLKALELPDDLLELLGRKKKSLSVALVLREIEDEDIRAEVTKDYEERGLTKEEVRDIVNGILGKKRKPKDLTSRVLPDDPRFTKARPRDVKFPDENYPPAPVDFDEYKGETFGAEDVLDAISGNIANGFSSNGNGFHAPELPPLRSSVDLGFDPADNFKVALNQLNHLYEALGAYERAGQRPPKQVAAKVRYYAEELDAMQNKLISRISNVDIEE